MKEKVSIITGASGEIGQNLILEFEKLNNKKIVAIDLKQTIKSKCIYKFYQKSSMTFIINLNLISFHCRVYT